MFKLRLLACSLVAATFVASPIISTVSAQQKMKDVVAQIHRDRIQASYLIAFGRKATEDEIKFWAQHSPKSVEYLVGRHNEYLSQNPGVKRDAVRLSYLHAFGTEPEEGHYRHWVPGSDNYTGLMTKHLQWLRGNAAEYEAVLKRSYDRVLRRGPDKAELDWWKKQGTFSFILLAAAHEDWASKNGVKAPTVTGKPTLKVTSSFLSTVTVQPEVAKEAARLIGNDAGSLIGNDAGSLVAAGAGNMVAAGGGNMVAAGGLN